MSFLHSLFRKKSVQDAIETARQEEVHGSGGLDKNLSLFDLTAFGIAAIIGAGIFSTIGKASFEGGPGVVFLFIFTAVACGFAAFAYAEFASMLPVSGSAYTYSYVAFGELLAWIIGWALVMEYAVGNITVAVSWSSYFTSLMDSAGWHVPEWAQLDYTSAHRLHDKATDLMNAGVDLKGDKYAAELEAFKAWTGAPSLGGMRIILDIPAIIMSVLITALVYVGIKESKTVGNAMVVLKMAVVLLVIIIGAGYVNVENWHPFVPNGFGGVMAGVSSVFFAYIGFDALSTTAEECKNPQRDLPRAMVYSIVICTLLYICIALVLTGMVSYTKLNVSDPLAEVFKITGMKWFSGIIAVSAVVAMAGVFLVFQLGQPRIWMTMSRDGLLPKRFSYIHPRFRTPSFATIVTGIFVVVPMLFIPSDTVLDLCSMGTLFAFVLVCAGVLKMQVNPHAPRGSFRTPYINGKWIFPALLLAGALAMGSMYPQETREWLGNTPQMRDASGLIDHLGPEQVTALKSAVSQRDSIGWKTAESDLLEYLDALDAPSYERLLTGSGYSYDQQYESGWALFQHKIPMWLFLITALVMGLLAFRHSLSLIPLLGLVCCLYMMAQISAHSWLGFFIWLVLGLTIYFGYGFKNSRLARKGSTTAG
ncbi:MAG TPA: amino acid permease [Saprospiraceae bacterium]|nr:amino acid permease [Saprospiraceae bacterium]HND89045.1 amino acid permease [Saprospiraceae bacterium]HNG89330.1 amino acid permease [Saprospiraceae bacterium]